jgi:hypothetical protein
MATIDEIVTMWDEKYPSKTEVYKGTKWRYPAGKNGNDKRGNIHIGGHQHNDGAEEFAYIKLSEKDNFVQFGANYIFVYPKDLKKGDGTIKIRFEINKKYKYKVNKDPTKIYDFLLKTFKDSFKLKDLGERKRCDEATDIWFLWKAKIKTGYILRLGIQLNTNSSAKQICEKMDYLIKETQEKLKIELYSNKTR